MAEKEDHEGFDKYQEILEEMEADECMACGGGLVLEKVNLEDYQEGKLYLMESVPAYVCQECGEIWVPEPIMEEFEKMIDTAKHRSQLMISNKTKRPKVFKRKEKM